MNLANSTTEDTDDHHDASSHDDLDVEKQSFRDESAAATSGELQRTESQFEYPEGKQVAVIMLALLLALFLVALDRTIIATAIPKITDEFNSLDDIGWYGSAFLLTACCFQMLLGRIYTFYTPKYVFLAVITLFEIGSVICGAAPNSIAFILGRAIAGAGSAGVMNGGIILMVSTVPLAKRPMFQGLFGAVFGVASVIGPLLGGAFTTDVSWRWCFYINLPIGAVVLVIIAFILKPTPPQDQGLTIRQQLAKLDLLGELFLFPCIICLLLALQWGGTTFPWSDGRIIALLVLFGVFLIAFIVVQIFNQATATFPATVIFNRSIIAGMWFVFCMASTMMLLVYYIPLWFQAIKGVSAVKSGIDTLPMILALVVGSIMAGQLVGRIGYYTPLMYASSIIMPIGAGLITTFNLSTGHSMWIGYQVLFGLGLGIGMQQSTMAAQTVLSRKDVPTGVSIMFFCQTLGGAIFISVGQNVLSNKLVQGLVGSIQGLDPAAIVNIGATDLRTLVLPQDLEAVLTVYNSALREVYIVAAAMASLTVFGALAMQWRSVKGRQGPGQKGAPESRPSSGSKSEKNVANEAEPVPSGAEVTEIILPPQPETRKEEAE